MISNHIIPKCHMQQYYLYYLQVCYINQNLKLLHLKLTKGSITKIYFYLIEAKKCIIATSTQ